MITALQQPDPVTAARALLGVEIVTRIDGRTSVGRITETEAYWAPDDQASHARNGRRTPRTEVFYASPGTAYVYLCYGIHELFNVVTGPEGTPHAVLVRAVEPVSGIDVMLERRAKKTLGPQLTAGPGVLSSALGISRAHNGLDLFDPDAPVRLRVTGPPVAASQIVAVPRIGIGYAGEPWVSKPWRFYLRGTEYVSKR